MYVPGNLSQSERRFLEQKVQPCANLVLRTSQSMSGKLMGQGHQRPVCKSEGTFWKIPHPKWRGSQEGKLKLVINLKSVHSIWRHMHSTLGPTSESVRKKGREDFTPCVHIWSFGFTPGGFSASVMSPMGVDLVIFSLEMGRWGLDKLKSMSKIKNQ